MFRKWVLISLLTSAFSTQAAIINYLTIFDGSIVGTTGLSSWQWNNSTNTISNIQWVFANGDSGQVDESRVDYESSLFGGTFSEFIFEILTSEDASPIGCNLLRTSCSTSLPTLGFTPFVTFSLDELNQQQYAFRNEQNELVAAGNFTTKVAVAEPSSLAIFASVFFGFGVWRRLQALHT